MPGWRLCALYKPLALVVTVRTSPVALFLITSFAAATAEPDWSKTCPARVAPANWARAVKPPTLRARVANIVKPHTRDFLRIPVPDIAPPLHLPKVHTLY